MRFALDHVVIAVEDLERAVADYRALGFTVEPGGRHPGRTSHNALVVFEDGSYLELIAWTAPNPAERWNVELIKHGEGFMDFALLPEDVPRAVVEASARGLTLKGPIDGGRVRPDGKELKWQTGRQATFDLPFLCGDVTPRELRVPTGAARRHANGASGIASVVVAVKDPDVSRARYEALLGVRLNTAAVELEGCSLVLAAPGGGTSDFEAAATRRLASRGEGPCGLILGGTARPAAVLDLAATHGALISAAVQNRGFRAVP